MSKHLLNKSEAILTQIKETQEALQLPVEFAMDVQPTVEEVQADAAKFIVTNIEMADIMPISALEPVC